MECKYEAPELTFVGKTDDVVLGIGTGGFDGAGEQSAPDFEFEQD